MSKLRRGPWSQREDATLIRLVQQQGPLNWVKISDILVSRSPKQCRERYHQNLKPSLNHEPISAEEGQLIEKLVGELGKRWAEIARRLNNRSDNAVKNWWNGSQNRRKRLLQRRRVSVGYESNNHLHHHQHHHQQQQQQQQHHHHDHRHLAASLGHRRPQLELATGAARILANHREPASPRATHYSHPAWNVPAPAPSGLLSPNSDRSSLYSVSAPIRTPTPSPNALAPQSPIALPPLRRNSYDTARPALRPELLPPAIVDRAGLRLPPIRTLEITNHQIPTAPNSPLESVASSMQPHNISYRQPHHYCSIPIRRRSSQYDEGDSRLKLSHLVD
ncbi:Homeodomain-like protein [Xylaria nigripes]|nr:Homeodomain-like protein [Xylaria nigripes]